MLNDDKKHNQKLRNKRKVLLAKMEEKIKEIPMIQKGKEESYYHKIAGLYIKITSLNVKLGEMTDRQAFRSMDREFKRIYKLVYRRK